MGRAKLEMKLIDKEKSRNTTFKKRKEGSLRKLGEFITLCDVKACMIIYGPQGGAAEPEIYPEDPDQVRGVIDMYNSKSKDSGIKSYGVADFFHEREKKIEEDLAKLRRKNLEAKYPTKPELLNIATEAQLREFFIQLRNKLKQVKTSIELLRNKQAASGPSSQSQSQSQSQSFVASGVFEGMNHHLLQHHHQHPFEMHLPFTDHYNSMMMLPMNDLASTSAMPQVFFDSAAARPPQMARYYVQPQQPYMLSAVVPPPQWLFSPHEAAQDDFTQYNVKNQTHNKLN